MHKIIRRVISKELSEFCYNYLYTKRKVTKLLFATEYINSEDHTSGRFDDPHVPGTYITYGDIAMETLLTKLHTLIEIETKQNYILLMDLLDFIKRAMFLKDT